MPAVLLSALGLIDNPWHVACDRSLKAGKALAHCLQTRAWGARPVTLIGFSLGTRVITEALHHLGPQSKAFVHDVVLMGGAVPVGDQVIQSAPRAVAGSVLNVFCDSDWVLAYLFRATSFSSAIGTRAIDHPGVLNLDVSNIVTGHLGYRAGLREVLYRVRPCLSAPSTPTPSTRRNVFRRLQPLPA
jgi:pimeloyl-ACP methyl ester carboxylesterase